MKIKESQLRQMIKESVKKVLKESAYDIDDDTYYGGGLPDSYNQDSAHEKPNEYNEPSIPEDISNFIYEKIKDFPEKIDELDAKSLSRLDNRFTYDVYWALCNENIEQTTAAKYVREYIKCYLPTYKTAYNKLRHVVEDAGWLFNETI